MSEENGYFEPRIPAWEYLAENRNQLDEDGIEVGVSREALDLTLARITQLESELAAVKVERDDYREGARVEAREGDLARAELAKLREPVGDEEVREALAFVGIAFKSGMPGRDEMAVLARAYRSKTAALKDAEVKIAALEKKS
jgi:hypothetical protein